MRDCKTFRTNVWRKCGELIGNPLLIDKIPSDATTTVVWTSTDRMVADALTKHMKPGMLGEVMKGVMVDLTPTKYNGCEMELSTTDVMTDLPWRSSTPSYI